MSYRRRFRASCTLALLLIFRPHFSVAQESTASIIGPITDESGGALLGVTVTA